MNTYIFDIDGTLANGDHRLHHIQKSPKDWDAYFAACFGDSPHLHICDLANALHRGGAQIIYLSGRSDICRSETKAWLRHHDLPSGPLYMRRQGDHTPDHVLKIAMLDQVIADGYKPDMVFDDRNSVVKAWRAAGLPCAQVAEGDF